MAKYIKLKVKKKSNMQSDCKVSRKRENLGVPVGLSINWLDMTDNELHSLGRQRVKLLWQMKDLMGFDLLLLSHINEPNKDAKKQMVSCVQYRQDLHPANENTVTRHIGVTYMSQSTHLV